jgi:hypothetical protein
VRSGAPLEQAFANLKALLRRAAASSSTPSPAHYLADAGCIPFNPEPLQKPA